MKHKPSFELTKAATTIFKDICEYLEERGELDQVDMTFVTVCAATGGRVLEYERIVADKGATLTYPNGQSGTSPDYKVLVSERAEFSRMCKALGITPAGREAVRLKGKRGTGNIAALNLLKIAAP